MCDFHNDPKLLFDCMFLHRHFPGPSRLQFSLKAFDKLPSAVWREKKGYFCSAGSRIWGSDFQIAQIFLLFSPQLESSVPARGRRTYKIEGEGANDIFIVNEYGELFVTKRLDREAKSQYRLTAKMYDDNVLLVDPEEFIVRVADINDNAPIFSKTYNGSIEERAPKGKLYRFSEKEIIKVEKLRKTFNLNLPVLLFSRNPSDCGDGYRCGRPHRSVRRTQVFPEVGGRDHRL